MRRFIFVVLAIITAFSPIAAIAQSIRIGLGGVRLNKDKDLSRAYKKCPCNRRLYREWRRACEDGEPLKADANAIAEPAADSDDNPALHALHLLSICRAGFAASDRY